MKKLLKNFLLCGLIGWCMEIIFTSIDSFRRRDRSLKGTTSIWMFPIYGMASFLSPLFHLIKEKNFALRGFTYAACIFLGEYITGRMLDNHEACPWDYSKSRWNIQRVVRLDYLIYWFFAGILFEHVLTKKKQP